MKRTRIGVYLTVAAVLAVAMLAACAKPAAPPPPSNDSVARGGRLYDKWWKEVPGAVEPTDNQALWALQTTNTRTGADTWRCKECHGWDYKGKDGAYGKGSHFTGFPGVMNAGQTKTVEELSAILKGSSNAQHDFSSALRSEDITDLANYLNNGLVDALSVIDYNTKEPIGGDEAKGKQLFDGTCTACHGPDGKMINFGSADEPEYVGTIAADNPWEFLHKVRAGQPGTPMPSAIVNGWTIQNVTDILSYAHELGHE